MTATQEATTPYRSTVEAGNDGLRQMVHAEWTKLRTVRGWMIGLAVAAVITVLIGTLGPLGSNTECASVNGGSCAVGAHTPPLGPLGQPVSDDLMFVHQTVSGDGSITARLSAMNGYYFVPTDAQGTPKSPTDLTQGLEPWARAGIIVKASTSPGAPYVAVVATGANGVRMETNFIDSTAAPSGSSGVGPASAASAASPRWLRLTRTGDSFTGYESADGVTWTAIGTETATGIPADAQTGLVVSSPDHTDVTHSFGGTSTSGGPSLTSATFDGVGLAGGWSTSATGTWTAPDETQRGPAASSLFDGGFTQTGGTFTLKASGGTVAPGVEGQGNDTKTIENGLIGAFAGLIALIVVATMSVTSEYRRGLIRTTLTASPHRGRVLAAKSAVIGAAAFVTGLVAASVAVPLVARMERSAGHYVLPVPTVTELRVIIGMAALTAVIAVFAVAVGTVLRRGAGAVALVIAVVVLPYVLAIASVLPTGTAQWLLRVSPAAGFAVQQTGVEYRNYPEVVSQYTPANGYYPLAPWAGFAVTCAYAVAALALAMYVLKRRDA